MTPSITRDSTRVIPENVLFYECYNDIKLNEITFWKE